MKKLQFTLILLLLMSSCKYNKNDFITVKDAVYINDNTFKTTRYLDSEIFNESFLSAPVRLSLIDSILFAIDPVNKSDTLVRLFCTNDRKYYGAYLLKGNGINEVLSIDRITKDKKNNLIWAYDLTSNKWFGYNYQNILLGGLNKVDTVINFNNTTLKNITNPQCTKEGIIANDLDKYQQRFLIYKNQKIEYKENTNLSFKSNVNPKILSDIFSNHMSYNFSHDKIILASKYINMIEIFNTTGVNIKTIICPNKNLNVEFDKDRTFQNGIFIKAPNTIRSYLKVVSSNDKIYALYSGKTKADNNNYSYSNVVYVFDIEGNPIEKIILQYDTSDIEVDLNDNYLYAIQKEPEPIIIRYKL